MKRIWLLNILIIFIISMSVSFVSAEETDYEAVVRLRNNIDNLIKEITEADSAIGMAASDMTSAPGALKTFHSAIDRYGQIAANNSRQIGIYLEQLIAIDPNVTIPTIQASYYEAQLNKDILALEANQRELDRIMTEFLDRQHYLAEDLERLSRREERNKAVDNISNAMEFTAKRTVGFAVTTGISMYAGVSLPVLASAIVVAAPVAGTVVVVGAAVTAGTLLLNDVIKLYTVYYDGGPATLLVEKQRIECKDALNRTMHEYNLLKPAAAKMAALAQEFKTDSDKFRVAREEIEKITAGWKGLVDASKKKKADEQSQAIQKQMNTPRAPVSIGETPPPPITASEYMDEAKAILAELESAAKAAMDGGDPDYFGDAAARNGEALMNRYQAAVNKQNEKQKTLEQFYYSQYYPRQDQISAAYWACDNALYGRYWRPIEGFYVAWRACADTANASYRANEAQLAPYRIAVREATRELTRLYLLHSAVTNGFGALNWMLTQYASATRTEYYTAYQQKALEVDKSSEASSELLSQLPYPSSFDYWAELANRLDSEVESKFFWGESPLAIRDWLFSSARMLRDQQDTIKKTLPKYRAALEAHRQETKAAQIFISTMLNKDALLLTSTWDGSVYNFQFPYLSSSDHPRHREGDRRKEMIAAEEKRIAESFKIYEPDYLKQLENANLETIAAKYDVKAAELDYIVAEIAFYRERKAIAVFMLDTISREQTKIGLYDERPNSAEETALEGLTRNEWENIVSQADKLKTIADEGPAMSWDKTPWNKKMPRDRLLRITGALYETASTILKNYIQMKQSGYGGFAFATDNAKLKQLDDDWQKVRPLLKSFDEMATSANSRIGNALDIINRSLPPVSRAYSAMSKIARNAVEQEHRRFNQTVGWLNGYLTAVKGALVPMTDPKYNNVVPSLDDWLTSYPKDRERYLEMQRIAEEEAERRQKAWETEQAKIKAEQEQMRQQEQRKTESGLAAVTALYDQFKQAYEARNDSQVISLMGDQWEAGDGTTLSDLQTNLSRSFRTFDDLTYRIQNLTIKLNQEGRYNVSYDVTITSRIFRRNLKHEEKSSINEEVVIDGSGKARISKTLGGRFWYVE